MVPASARACSHPGAQERVSGCWKRNSGCPGARFRLPGSTCPGAHFGLPGSTFQVAREHNLALPGFGCPGTRFRLPRSTLQSSGCPGAHVKLPGSTLQVPREHISGFPGAQLSITWVRLPGARFNGHWKGVDGARIAMFPNYDRTEFTKALPQRGFMKLR